MNRTHIHNSMRRRDREIRDRSQIDAILYSETVMHLAISDNNIPFVVPLFYAYDGTSIYFHSARSGTKMEILKRNSVVCFEVCVNEGVIHSNAACDFEAKHRTVIGFGNVRMVTDRAEKIKALDLIVARFTDKKFDYPMDNLKRTQVVRIDITAINGKTHTA
jgi:uncharacterized protein